MRKKSIEKFFKKTFIATMAMMLTLGSPMTSLMAMAEESNDSDGKASRNESSDEHQEEAKEHSETASKSAEESKSSVSAAKDHVGSDNSQSSASDSTDEKTEKSCADEVGKAAEAVADKKIEAEGKASAFKADSDTYDQSAVSANSTVVEGIQDVAEDAGEAAKDAVKAADDTISAANDATDDLKEAVEEAYTAETEAKQAADKAAEEAGKAAAEMDAILSDAMVAEDKLKTEVSDYNKTVSEDESSISDYAEKIDVQTTEGEDGSLECQIVIKTTDEEGKEVKKDIIEVTGETVQNAVDANANVQSDMKELLKKNSWDEECDEILKRMETERDAAGEAKADAEVIYNSSVKALKNTIDAYNEYARKYGLSTIKMDEKTFELSFDDELTQASEMLKAEDRINAAQAGFDKYSTEVESIMAAVNSAEKALEEAENAYKTAAEAVSEAATLLETIKTTADGAVSDANNAVTDANSAIGTANEVVDEYDSKYSDVKGYSAFEYFMKSEYMKEKVDANATDIQIEWNTFDDVTKNYATVTYKDGDGNTQTRYFNYVYTSVEDSDKIAIFEKKDHYEYTDKQGNITTYTLEQISGDQKDNDSVKIGENFYKIGTPTSNESKITASVGEDTKQPDTSYTTITNQETELVVNEDGTVSRVTRGDVSVTQYTKQEIESSDTEFNSQEEAKASVIPTGDNVVADSVQVDVGTNTYYDASAEYTVKYATSLTKKVDAFHKKRIQTELQKELSKECKVIVADGKDHLLYKADGKTYLVEVKVDSANMIKDNRFGKDEFEVSYTVTYTPMKVKKVNDITKWNHEGAAFVNHIGNGWGYDVYYYDNTGTTTITGQKLSSDDAVVGALKQNVTAPEKVKGATVQIELKNKTQTSQSKYYVTGGSYTSYDMTTKSGEVISSETYGNAQKLTYVSHDNDSNSEYKGGNYTDNNANAYRNWKQSFKEFNKLDLMEAYNNSYNTGEGSDYKHVKDKLDAIAGLGAGISISASKALFDTDYAKMTDTSVTDQGTPVGTKVQIESLISKVADENNAHAYKVNFSNAQVAISNALSKLYESIMQLSASTSIANKNYQIANSQYASADNTYSWAESLNKQHQANAYVQYDENAGDIVDNHYGYDLDTITSNTSKNFQKISNGEFDVPYTLYRDLVAELYENNSFAATKNDDFIGVGSHSELYLKGLTQKQGTLKPYYWEIGNDGKLTGAYFTDKNDMETGRYFLGYSFKIEASDGIHLDGYYYDYVKPIVTPEEKPEDKENKKTESKSDDSKKQSSNKNTNTTNTVIDDEATPLAVLSTDSMSVIDDAPVPLASSVSIIDEEPVALESVLKTGDATIPLIPLAAVGTVMIGTAYLISTLKRRPRK